MKPHKEERYVLRDMRTNKFFGGGNAGELFSHWITKWTEAKKFPTPESIRPVLTQMMARRDRYLNDAKVSELILNSIPLFEPHVYMIHKIEVVKNIVEMGLIVT